MAEVHIAIFAGALLASTTGFGFNLLTVPVLVLMVGPKDAIPLSLAIGLLVNLLLLGTREVRSAIDGALWGRLVGYGLLGLPVGLAVFTWISPELLAAGIGIAVFLYASVSLLPAVRRLKMSHGSLPIVGFISGSLASSTSLSGPPVIIYAHGIGLEKATFRATIVAYVTVVGGLGLLVLIIASPEAWPTVSSSVNYAPAALLGTATGYATHKSVGQDHFRKIVLGSLLVIGLVTSVGAIVGTL